MFTSQKKLIVLGVIAVLSIPGLARIRNSASNELYTPDTFDTSKVEPIEIDWKSYLENKLERIYFAKNSAKLDRADIEKLQEVAELMREYPGYNLIITGKTDAIGTSSHNYSLGLDRALTVKEKLIDLGLDWERVYAISHGEASSLTTEKKVDPTKRVVEFKLIERIMQLSE